MKKIDYSTQYLNQDDIDGIIEVLNSPFLTQGKKVEEFEKTLCSYTGAKHAISFNSATSALFCAYTVANISQKDEIITTPISFVATSNMFVELGATPVWCDIKEDGNIDESLIESLITSNTKAIVPVHFAGKPVNIYAIHKIAKKHNLLVIEDAAHALGSSIRKKKIGSFSDMSIFSFHAIKPITTGEGGAVLTDNDKYARELKLLRSHGMIKKDLYKSDMVQQGYNYRMTEIAASLGITQMKRLDDFIQTRYTIASYYDEKFKSEELLDIIQIDKDNISARHLYPILLSEVLLSQRDAIFQELQEKGLGVQVHYKPIYQNSFYINKYKKFSLAKADNFYLREISIPCHQKMDLKMVEYVVQTILTTLKKHYNMVQKND